jgi:DNA-binding LacI/PurR family transcriptional regulator
VARSDARTLLAQVADGLREAIVGGYYVPGDIVPSSRELARILGVSEIVSRAALRRIADDGFVVARPRVGSVVRDRASMQWRGHVVFVCPELDVGFFQTVLIETLRTRLNKRGYLFTRASIEHCGANGKYDFSLLDAALARSVDLVVVLYDRPAIFSHLEKRGVPFAAVAGMEKAPSGAIGFTSIDFNTAVPDFIASCKAAGAGKVVEYRLPEIMCDAVPALREAGIAATSVSLKPDYAKGKFFAIEEAGMNAVEKALSAGRFDRAAVHFLSSEYLMRGALLALSRAGLEAPRDVRVVAWANAGMGPSYFRELSRMEMDPVRAGATVAEAALEFLDKGAWPTNSVIGPSWKLGETLGTHGR